MFHIGDKVKVKDGIADKNRWGDNIGVIVYIGYAVIIVQFEVPNGVGPGKNQWNFDKEEIILVSECIILTKEERIHKKIKTLWNKSNWVLKNPHLGY